MKQKGNAVQKKGMPEALVITRNLPPLVGGMERLVWHIVDALRQEFQVHVIGPEGCLDHLPHGVGCSEVPLTPLFGFLLLAQLAAIGSAFRKKPQFVLAGSGLTAPLAWLVSRIFKARCYVYLHGLDIEANHILYRMFWRPVFRKFDGVIVNSRFTKQLAVNAGVAAHRIRVIHPGVTLPDCRDATRIRTAFRQRHDLGPYPLMLYVGRITSRKGFAIFVRDILPLIVDEIADAKLLVIGDEPKYALQHRTGEHQRALDALITNKLRDSVVFMSAVDDASLSAAYFAADVLVFPVQDIPHDHEGFGMVALEAAAHGLPTVAFASGGVTDAVADGVSGKLIPAGDNKAFAQAVIFYQTTNVSSCTDKIGAFASKFAWPLFGEKLRHFSSTFSNPIA